jgi:hypothetical protein
MKILSDQESESLYGGLRFGMPVIQVSPSIIVNTLPQINAGSAIGLFGGIASLEQENKTYLWNSLISLLGVRK